MIVYNCKENKKSGNWWCGYRAFLCSLTPFNCAAHINFDPAKTLAATLYNDAQHTYLLATLWDTTFCRAFLFQRNRGDHDCLTNRSIHAHIPAVRSWCRMERNIVKSIRACTRKRCGQHRPEATVPGGIKPGRCTWLHIHFVSSA